MLASFPASMVNQKSTDLGIPNRFKLISSRFSRATRKPFPLVDVDRAAGTPRDRTDLDVAIEDVPAVLAFGISAAGERGGHAT
jgi:hypothetical protein